MIEFNTPKQSVKVTVMGIKSFKGSIDGKEFDSASIFVVTSLDDTRGTAKGYASVEYKAGDSSIFQRVKHLPFPHEAEIVIENVTSGSAVKTIVREYKPVGLSTPAQSGNSTPAQPGNSSPTPGTRGA